MVLQVCSVSLRIHPIECLSYFSTEQRAQAMVLNDKGFAVKDCVISVPPYLTQQERLAWLNAAKIAGDVQIKLNR